MNFSERFPEIYRYGRQEAGKTRLVAGLITINLVCAVVAFIESRQTEMHWYTYCDQIIFAQMLVLFFYGTICTAKTVTQERADRTWDFQRLTPLSSFEMTAGKFFGGPIFAWFLFSLGLPWAVFSAWLAPEITFGVLLKEYAVGISVGLALLSLGMLVSAYNDFSGGRSAQAAGPLIGLLGASWLPLMAYALQQYHKNPNDSRFLCDVSFFWFDLSGTVLLLFSVASLLVFAGWFFAGAKWRIGRDLLERPVFGRLPAFLVFLCWYHLGIKFSEAYTAGGVMANIIGVPCAVVYLASFVTAERTDVWKRWRSGGNLRERLARTPVWVSGCATMILISGLFLLSMCTSPFVKYAGGSGLLVLLPAFLVRDMCFLQWCRLTNSRRPEVMALTYIAVMYFLPLMVMGSLKLNKLFFIFAPVPNTDLGFAVNVAPSVLQACAMAYFMLDKMKSKLHSAVLF